MPRDYDNVILFGAGASADAGIPMLESFVDKMWEYAIRGKVGNKLIPPEDREILTKANELRIELERYNSRAFFDNRNIEDILSLLYFEAIADGQRTKYDLMVKAVSRTIELSCLFQFSQEPLKRPVGGSDYHGFWHCLLHSEIRNAFPALITFNYDLVLERTLWEHFHFLDEMPNKRVIKSTQIQYGYGIYDFIIRGEPYRYDYSASQYQPDFRNGQIAIIDRDGEADIKVPYLKLHGSLNWDRNHPSKPTTESGDRITPNSGPTMAVESPLILPPVFNKTDAVKINSVWETALKILRNAKNIIIVGYSLPKTDIYMQYFLKSAVGPNSNLQRIIVFDPVLFQENDRSAEMKQRYKECFSPQFSGRIVFQPIPDIYHSTNTRRGDFHHFVEILRRNPKELFFYH